MRLCAPARANALRGAVLTWLDVYATVMFSVATLGKAAGLALLAGRHISACPRAVHLYLNGGVTAAA